MSGRKASIKETGEELSQDEWARFDAAVAEMRAERPRTGSHRPNLGGLRATPRPTGARPKDPLAHS